MSLQHLDLTKSADKLQLSLKKAGVHTPPVVEVGFDLDVSGSYEDEHLDGTTTLLMTRLIPWGLVFDPDKKLDVFTFSDGPSHAHYVGDLTATNYQDYVNRNVIRKVPGWRGGTDYAPVIRRNLAHFGWIATETASASAEAPRKTGGFMGGLFGGKKEIPSTPTEPPAAPGPKRKSLILFNTDGSNDDKDATWTLFEEMEREKYGVYVMFIAYANGSHVSFDFLQKIAKRFSNCGLAVIRDMKAWVGQDDEHINNELITEELVAWLNQ